jgi:hypothetical protein
MLFCNNIKRFRRIFMKLWGKGILLAGVFVFVLVGYAFGGEKLISEVYAGRQAFLKVGQDGEIWLGYYDPKNGIHIHNADTGKDFLLNDGKQNVSSGLAFDVVNGNLLASWREKPGEKELYFRASHDNGKTLSDPVLLDDGKTKPLARIQMGADSKGNVGIEWYGETRIGHDKDHIYAACSNDFGKTFSKPENLTLGYGHSIYPAFLVDDKGAYAFSYSEREGKKYMVFRKSSDGCKTWTKPLDIKEIGIVSLFVVPVRVGNRLHVFWHNFYNNVPVVEGAYSDDDGATWKTTVLESTRGLDTGLMKVVGDSKGHIYISLHGVKAKKEKEMVYLVRSEDNGATWGKMIPMRHCPSNETKAEMLIIRAEDDGTVVAVWRDYRNIRSNIYMQYSKDYGKTWQKNDIPLEEPGRFNTMFYPYTAEIVKLKDRYYFLVDRFRDDAFDRADLILLDFTLEQGGQKK